MCWFPLPLDVRLSVNPSSINQPLERGPPSFPSAILPSSILPAAALPNKTDRTRHTLSCSLAVVAVSRNCVSAPPRVPVSWSFHESQAIRGSFGSQGRPTGVEGIRSCSVPRSCASLYLCSGENKEKYEPMTTCRAQNQGRRATSASEEAMTKNERAAFCTAERELLTMADSMQFDEAVVDDPRSPTFACHPFCQMVELGVRSASVILQAPSLWPHSPTTLHFAKLSLLCSALPYSPNVQSCV
ncbi:hypothetical protein HDK64DRAFT_268505 [Phyllosticta capitalensis]